MHVWRTLSRTPFSRPLSRRLPGLLGLATLAALTPSPAYAQPTILTGTQTGADGAPNSGPGTSYGGYSVLYGNVAASGVYAASSDFFVHDAAFTGGTGGTATGTTGANGVAGGLGGDGLAVNSGAHVTIAGGAFTGGAGGVAQGTSTDFNNGGDGGGGLYVNNSTVTINGGTFTGGTGGGAGGNSAQFSGGQGGDGLNANYNAFVTINGGTFVGGNGASVTRAGGSAYDGAPYPGLELVGGSINIYGGTFTGGGYDPNAPHGQRFNFNGYGISGPDGTATLYGSGFTVNGVSNFTGAVPRGTGTITGLLQNNASVTTITYNLPATYTSQIFLAPAIAATPEPSQAAALGLGALGLAGLMLKARKRRPVA